MALRIEIWLAAVVAVAALAVPAAAEDDARGKLLYENCRVCHGALGQGDDLAEGPSIAGLEAWYVEAQLIKFRNGWRASHPDDYSGLRMRPMSRTLKDDAEVKAVAAYVASLPKRKPEPVLTGGDPERGKSLYRPCAACHGSNAEGRKALNGPALNHSNDWYLLSSLQKYKSGIRGGNPEDTTGAMMRAMSGTLTDEQVMKDIIAHIATLPIE